MTTPRVTSISKQPTTGSRSLPVPAKDVTLDAYEVGELMYNGFPFTADLTDLITDAQVERSIEEATTLTLTLHDPERVLRPSGILNERADLDVGTHQFRLVRVSKSGDDFTLEFEDRDVARLRLERKPRKVSRGKVTRAEFAKLIVDDTPGIGFFCPDLHKKQPITDADKATGTVVKKTTDSSSPSSASASGFAPGVKLKVKGATASAHQLAEASRLLGVAKKLNASPAAQRALIFAAIAESGIGGQAGAYAPNGSGYWGVLQGGSGQNGSAANFPDPHDTEAFAHYFLLGGKGFNAGGAISLTKAGITDPAEIAVKVETPSIWPNNAYAGEAGYSNFKSEAEAIIAAYTGEPFDPTTDSGSTTTETSKTIAKPYEFTRGLPSPQPGEPPENTWDCLKRLADEVQRRRFLIDHVVTFAFEKDLLALQPSMTISETDDGIDWIDFDKDEGKRVETATVTCRADMWSAKPGACVVIEDVTDGVDGRWLVSRVSGPLFLPDRTIELTRGLKALAEPAHDTLTKTTTATDGTAGASGSAAAGSVRAAAKAISDRALPYGVGGHGQTWAQAQSATTYDCSSSTSMALHNGGVLSSVPGPQVSDFFLSWGEPGEGKTFTVWVKPGSGANGHVYIRFPDGYEFNTAGHPAVSGPRLLKQEYPRAGLVARHAPGDGVDS
ncbi:MAG: hypothetical protein JWM31_1254 [Solirubrobacterales bacterium]|nr:hypothetical protein [Solirubrobacterales bacterium]